jgi:sugar phosphate isomerase/epimerase
MKTGSKDFTEVGNGTIDFERIFKAEKQAGLQYWFLEQDSSDKDIFESIRISRDFIDKHNFFLK